MKTKKIIGEISKTILCLLIGLVATILVYGSILHLGWKAIYLWGGIVLWTFLIYTALAWRKEGK